LARRLDNDNDDLPHVLGAVRRLRGDFAAASARFVEAAAPLPMKDHWARSSE
jgi:hypothetical protein